jgi:hypothetical protein
MKVDDDFAIQGEQLKALMKDYKEQQSRMLKRTSGRISKRRKRKSGFRVQWVKLPIRWIERLQAANVGAATFKLAHVILVENFKFEQMAVKKIILSKEATGLSRKARWRATNNLVRLKLIRARRKKGEAIRVEDIYN